MVHRDGVNEYMINGSPTRLRDIIELLANANIGSSGHHIISQGEADKILNASAKERKTMIEDSLGLKIYQYKRQESERKLLKTKDDKWFKSNVKGSNMNNHWAWYHVMEHQANHMGQIRLIINRLPK